VTVDDKWHIGSCTKSMTAVVAAMLVEEGRFRWDTTLAEMFPELAQEMQTEWRAVTLEQLLTHHGGAPHELDEGGLWFELRMQAHRPPREQRGDLTRELLTKQKPEAPPGTQYIYSNAGYAIVGHAIEQKLDRPWEDVMQERLFRPLGLDSAGFGPPAAMDWMHQPWGHQTDKEGRLKPIPPMLRVADNPAAIAPAGTVHCTIGDLARYSAWQVRGARGQGTLLKPETFKKLHTRFSGGGDYAMGWNVVSRPWGGGEVLTHGGSNTMFYTVIWLAPKKDFAVVVCTNVGGDPGTKATDAAAWALIQKYLKEQTP
jgi:CubicO group peptidase (beta-lactamase class C family)